MNIPTANPLPIIDNDTTASGTITAAAQTVAIVLNGDSGAAIQITGTWVGTFQFEGTLDGTNWVAINAVAASTSLPQVTNTVNGLFRLTPSGLAQMRVNAIAWTSGTATISIRAGAGTGGTFINQIAPVKISDGITLATVKPASTAAVATDPAIVVAISPNNILPVSLAAETTKVIGKVGIDQTTDGTTNAVRLLAETTKVIGTVNVAGTVPVSGTFFQGTQPVSIATMPSTPVTGTFFQATQPVSLATNTPDVIDRAARLLGVLSTGANTIGAVTNANLDVALSTRLKPADTLAAVTLISDTRQSIAANLNATVVQQVITKNTQGTTGVTTQDLKDAGRNAVHFYTVIPVISTATDTLQSLTGTKSGVTVVATTTPAVVTTGKTFRVTRLSATYIATSVSGYGIVRLRFNTAGVVAITSPIAATLAIGTGTPATANSTSSEEAILDEGLEFAAATGIGISVQGFAAVTATAVGFVMVSITGYEY